MKSHSAAHVTWCVKLGYHAMVTPRARCSSWLRKRGRRPFMNENGPFTTDRARRISSTECGDSSCTQSTPASRS
jgi:hypothetical protein